MTLVSGTQILARLSDNVRQDDLNRHGLLVDRLKQVSAKLDDIDRKICQAFLQFKEHKLPSLEALRSRVETDRQSIIALMQAGRFVQPTTRSVSRTFKSDLERRQGKAYSQYELAGRDAPLITAPRVSKRWSEK